MFFGIYSTCYTQTQYDDGDDGGRGVLLLLHIAVTN